MAASADQGPVDPDIRALAGLLRAVGLDPSAGELADALWLAARTRARPVPAGPDPVRADPGERRGEPPAERPPPPPRREEPEAEDPVRLYAAGARYGAEDDPDAEIPAGGGVPVRVPGAAALPRILDIQRALRALQRHRPPGRPVRTVLDEAATAEASARAPGLVIPVLRPETRREATVRLVMDASPSMAVWQEMFEELRSVCERLGAFRDVQAHYLHRLADGTAAVGRGPSPATALRSGDQLRDPTGRALTMVVSDCTGPVWREGEAQRLLHRWAECTPCVIVQPLPQRLWNRSWLPTERGVLEHAQGGGGAVGGGLNLRFRPDRPPRPGQPTGGLTVPVLPPHAAALGAWARLVAGLGTGPVPAEVGRVLARHPAAPVPLPRTARPPRELVSRFRASAAPGAVQLAVYLAAAPLTLPVMRLVQRTMLPDSEPSDLAEVLLGGLLRRSGEPPGHWYEFVPGVQDVLLGPLGRDEAALVLKHCSEYVRAHFGRGVRDFPALAVSQLTGVPPDGPADDPGRVPAGRLPQAFAHVSAKVVRRYLPGPPEDDPDAAPVPEPGPSAPAGRAPGLRAARDRLADGDARALHEAAALLRRAVAAPAGPEDPPEEAETELAGALLRLWAVQRDPELLDEAERAVTGLGSPPARAARGRVLYERALAAVPDPALLAAADREFAAAGAAAGPALRRDCAVRRAQTLIRLGALRDDPGPLHEARSALEALTGPDDAPGGDLTPPWPWPSGGSCWPCCPAPRTPRSAPPWPGGPPHTCHGPSPRSSPSRPPRPPRTPAPPPGRAPRPRAPPRAPPAYGWNWPRPCGTCPPGWRRRPGSWPAPWTGPPPNPRRGSPPCSAWPGCTGPATPVTRTRRPWRRPPRPTGAPAGCSPGTGRPSPGCCPSGATYSWTGRAPWGAAASPPPPYGSCARAARRCPSPTREPPTGCCGWPPACGCGTPTRGTSSTCGKRSTCWNSPSARATTPWNGPAPGATTATSSRRSTPTPAP